MNDADRYAALDTKHDLCDEHPCLECDTYLECPRCHKLTLREIEVENALSRVDNHTYICSGCGNEEAFLDAGLATYLEDEDGAVKRSLEFAEALGLD